MAGRIDAMFETMTVTLPQVRAGKLKALAVTSRERSAFLPEVPPMSQFLPGFEMTSFLGLGGPPGMPRPIVDRLARELSAALLTPAVREKYGALGADPMPMGAHDFDEYIRREIELNVAIVRAVGIKQE
jgi:tripartite-type tricarboxylate transporter receptor subunit TctC